MNLNQYLNLPDSLKQNEIAKRMHGSVDASFVGQWRRWYSAGRIHVKSVRQPSPVRCVELVRIDKRMTLQALRPDDWMRIWPTLPGASKARAAQAETEPA